MIDRIVGEKLRRGLRFRVVSSDLPHSDILFIFEIALFSLNSDVIAAV
jgi:hypothetical protein